ncbi:hypothetical protein ASF40_11205 [Microbacterium sp. Leaf288]|uniref:hypothetical protein n=1 Tax=Microbacterium sp. Leaf288 TaxID=1736323 RepID=UPI0006FC6050|nr:hypothetical protein [Microbacterium sp. Leaf288]KQP70349.1 hypothetical protein ASF40_11205 [Microbacterium sp. Leaf288]
MGASGAGVPTPASAAADPTMGASGAGVPTPASAAADPRLRTEHATRRHRLPRTGVSTPASAAADPTMNAGGAGVRDQPPRPSQVAVPSDST